MCTPDSLTAPRSRPASARTRVHRAAPFLALGLFILLDPSLAATHTWPGVSPCTGTLQACINGVAPGDRIEIVGSPVIDESLAIPKSLTLRAAPGSRPELAAGRNVTSSLAGSADWNVVLEGLTFRDGVVQLGYHGTGSSRLVARDLQFLSPTDSFQRILLFNESSATSFEAEVTGCRIRTRTSSGQGGAIHVITETTGAEILVSYNLVESPVPSAGAGIYVETNEGASATAFVVSNETRGSFFRGGIAAAEGEDSSNASTFDVLVANNVVVDPGAGPPATGIGVALMTNTGTLSSVILNNTVTGHDRGLWLTHLTSGAGHHASVANNLVAYNTTNMAQLLPSYDVTDGYNLVYPLSTSNYGLGATSASMIPDIESVRYPRLLPGSPAIDAGSSVDALFTLGAAGLPFHDRDGLQRFVGTAIDIGAYETGDASFGASGTNGVDHYLAFSHPSTDGDPAANPLAVMGGTFNDHPLGVYYGSGNWYVFNQDLVPIPFFAEFHVFAPGPGDHHFVHTATASNTSGHVTTIDNAWTNDAPNQIVFATQNWSEGGPGPYNAREIAVGYIAFGGPGAWYILNQDFTNLPASSSFDLYVQEPSPNAYRHVTGSHNSPGSFTILDHPLLNGNACARPMIGKTALGTADDSTVGLFYLSSARRWVIANQDGAPMPWGVVFHVLVDPAQVHACGLIFSGDFESGTSSGWSATVG